MVYGHSIWVWRQLNGVLRTEQNSLADSRGNGYVADKLPTASELILEWGYGEARPEGQRAGDGVLGEGTVSPSHQLGVCGSAVSSLSGVRGTAPAAEGFSCILSRQIVVPSISECVA